MVAAGYSILVVDDHPLIRHGLRELIEQNEGPIAFYEAEDPRQALPLIRQKRPDVVVLDLTFPDTNGMEAIAAIRDASPKTEVLVFTMHVSPQAVRQAFREGARGFVTKLDPLQDLIAGIRAVRDKQEFLSHGLVRDSACFSVMAGAAQGEGMKLSDRETEVAKLLAEGRSNKEIAKKLERSVRTIEAHRTRIMRKMQFTSISELVRFAIRVKWIE